MVLGKYKISWNKYSEMGLDQRRHSFLQKNDLFKRNESLILENRHQRIIYTPRPVSPHRIKNGQFISGQSFSVCLQVFPSECHNLAIALYKHYPASEVWTGYALSDDGKWREHSWTKINNEFFEATGIPRVKYFGFKLSNSDLNKLIKN